MTYSVSLQHVVPRPLAAVRAQMPIAQVPARFGALLSEVYDFAKREHVALDGQNVFVYQSSESPLTDVLFGVGVHAPFPQNGRVELAATPEGDAATTAHWGDYTALGAAHNAVVTWCKREGHALTGTCWEVYGHWSDDPAQRRTDVYHLIQRTQ